MLIPRASSSASAIRFFILTILLFIFFVSCSCAEETVLLKHPMTGFTAQENFDRVREVVSHAASVYHPEGKISVEERKAFLKKFLAGEGMEVVSFAQIIQNYDDEAAESLKKCSIGFKKRDRSHILWNGAANFYGPYLGPFIVYSIENGNYFFVEKMNNVPLSQTAKFPWREKQEQYRSHGVSIIKSPIQEYKCFPVEEFMTAVCQGTISCNPSPYSGLLKYEGQYIYYFIRGSGESHGCFELTIYFIKFSGNVSMSSYRYIGLYGDL